MEFNETSLKGAYTIQLNPYKDGRGEFTRLFCSRELEKINHTLPLVQINHSLNTIKGTIRGMHFQFPPKGETKIIHCIAGSIYDVIIDLRKDSPTYLKWFGVTLSADQNNGIYVPPGFAHGFQTLEDHTSLLYLHTAFYEAEYEGGLRYDDPAVNINWPLDVIKISERDLSHPLISENFKGI